MNRLHEKGPSVLEDVRSNFGMSFARPITPVKKPTESKVQQREKAKENFKHASTANDTVQLMSSS